MNSNDKVNVLLVDDQPGKLLSYEVMLGELGENLIKASSGKDALEILLKKDVAVILIDVCMPELDGFELARMIRDHPRFQRTAIIFISGIHISQTDLLRGYNAGAVDYVPVPVVPEMLRAKVKVFAELYRKTHLLEELNRELENRVIERTAELELAAARLLESEQGRSLALAAGNMGSWEFNLKDDNWVVDEGQWQIFGVTSDVKSSAAGFVKSLIHPEDWNRLLQSAHEATRSNRTFQSELRIVRQSGEMRSCLVAAAVALDFEGNLHRVSGVSIDITERKEAENRQALLAREVDHRARNALTIVQAIVRLSRAATVEHYTESVEGRIRALALSHELLAESRWQGADMMRLVAEEFAPHQSGDNPRAQGHGPSIILSADKAQSIALLIHELTTNAVKYGSLSVPTGRVDLRWDVYDGKLRLEWMETGGPAAIRPKENGFGTRIIESSLDRRHGDSASFEWLPEGLQCTIILSISPPRDGLWSQNRRSGNGIDQSRSRQPQILLVEDEPLVGMLTSELVSEMGYKVLGPFASVAEAMEASRNCRIDGAILDMNLAGEPVFPLAKKLAERSVPIMFLTGYEKSRVEQGFDKFPVLQKPVTADELENVLTSIMVPGDGPTKVTM